MHIMLDLETWGLRPGSDIRSIGATVFNPITGDVSIPCETCKGGTTRGNVNDGGDCSDCMNSRMERGYGDVFYVATDNPIVVNGFFDATTRREIEPIRQYRLIREPETVKWWNDQSPEAHAAFVNPVELREACQHFTSFVCNTLVIAPPEGFKDLRIWANDPHFDVSILDVVFRAVGLPVPWHYRSPRSMKTITEAAGMTSADYCNYGVAHHAMHDAIAHAMTVCEAYKRLGLRK